MNNILSKTRIAEGIHNISKMIEENKSRLLRPLLEKLGSYDGQYEETELIARHLIDSPDGKYSDGEFEYTLLFDRGIGKVCKGELNGNKVTITVDKRYLRSVDIYGTVAHELMHIFQSKLKNVHGVNETSMNMYQRLIQFANMSDTWFCYEFFMGLYYCFSIERAANVSSIANYLGEYFRGKKIVDTKEVMLALERNDKYQAYQQFLTYFQNAKPTQDEKEFIERCMTSEYSNLYGGGTICFFSPDSFDVDIFVRKIVMRIITYSKDTIERMSKNAMLFLNKREK